MEMWRREDIQPICDEKSRASHTAKHLYAPRERWQDIIVDLGDARQRALKPGCCTEASIKKYNNFNAECHQHLLRDHDRFYCPKYMEALECAESSGLFRRMKPPTSTQGPTMKQDWTFVSQEGVMVRVREVGVENRPKVMSAYRPRLSPQEKHPTSQTFFDEAVRKLNDKTSWYCGG